MKFNKKSKSKAIGYRIPQFDEGYDGLKQGKANFKKSEIGSPLFGSNVKDTMFINDISEKLDIDIRKNYDFAREEKKISKQELIEKYGTEFYEFQMIDNVKRKQIYGDDISVNNKKTKETSYQTKEDLGFSFVKDVSDIVSEDKNDISNNEYDVEEDTPSFKFDSFKSYNDDNEEALDFSFGEFKPKYQESKHEYTPNLDNSSTLIRSPGYENDFKVKENKPVERVSGYSYENINVNASHNITNDFSSGQTRSFEYQQPRPENTYNDYMNNSNNYSSNNFSTINTQNTYKKEDSFALPKIVDPYRDYVLPSRNLFKRSEESSLEIPEWVEEKKQIINQTLIDFDLPGEVIKCTKGPTFSRYEIMLQSGINIKKIVTLKDTFQMNLGAKTLRILAPIPGKRTIGLEVPNDQTETIYFGDIINDEFYSDNNPLKIALGKDIDNNCIYTSIDKWPHGLIAGSTGSGKSVCMNTILLSLLLRNKPDEVKLLLVDPKTVELISYNELPHLVTPVINDPSLASEALKWACEEMDRRYQFLSVNRVRSIKDYNEKALENPAMQKMCYIVIVIDELADLMMTCSNDVEASIMRITQKARAAGIHILVATQRPTVDIIKGNIKANIPTRVAFKTVSQIDSSTILDETGAEELLGRGDMLLKEADQPKRLQGAYMPDTEIDAVTDFIRAQAQPDYLFTHDDLRKKVASTNASGPQSTQESPQMLFDAAMFFIINGSCSINALQQRFGLGFNRANRIVTALEEMNIVSPKNGTKGREMLCSEEELRQIFEIGE